MTIRESLESVLYQALKAAVEAGGVAPERNSTAFS